MSDSNIRSKVDYLIVGQGLAGTLISHLLLEMGKSVLVIDDSNPHSASNISSGIINPVTGRRFVKSWRFDELFNASKQLYRQLESQLNISVWKDVRILRAIRNIRDENIIESKLGGDEYQSFVNRPADLAAYASTIHQAMGYVELLGAVVDVSHLLTSYRNWLIIKGHHIESVFHFDKLRLTNHSCFYGEIEPGSIVFCEGWKGIRNPFFSWVPLEPVKGEVMHVEIPAIKTEKILKQELFLVPQNYPNFWVGSTVDWDDLNEIPTSTKKRYLTRRLRQLLKVDFRVLDHLAGVRPSSKDRRPLLGQHQEYHQLYFFNGLGTKGASLAPFWARKFVEFIECGKDLDPKVNIKRF